MLAGVVAAIAGFGIGSLLTLVGALLHARVSGSALATVFGTLLILAGVAEPTGWVQRVR